MKNCVSLFFKFAFLFFSIKAYSFNIPQGQIYLADTSTIPGEGSIIVSPGATLQLVSNKFSFTEGPAADKNGNIFFTDQPADKIWKYDTDGKLSVFLDKTGRSN